MSELVKHIQDINAKTRAWVAEDPDNRGAGMLVEDPAHWAEYGITTVAQFKRNALEEFVSDTHKALYGTRFRGMANMTDAELGAFADRLVAEQGED